MNCIVFSYSDNTDFVSAWYNGDLKKLKTSCVKIQNLVDSIHGIQIAEGDRDVE